MGVVKAGLLKGRGDLPFPTPEEAAAHSFTAEEARVLTSFRVHQAHGSPETVAKHLTDLADLTGADVLMPVMPSTPWPTD